MDVALILSAGLLGLMGAPHCSAMCSAPCAAVARRCGEGAPRAALAGFMTGRIVGYAAGGAAVAASVLTFNAIGSVAPVLRPLWTVAHAAALALGLWLLFSGRQPAWWGSAARVPVPLSIPRPGNWQRVQMPAKAGLAGAMWVAMPCGLLQSALLVSALAGTAMQGAAAMTAFAVASSVGLGVLPAIWSARMSTRRAATWPVRVAGLALAVTSGWALAHGLWQRVADLCLAA